MKLLAPAILAAVLVVSACDGGTNQATPDVGESEAGRGDASAALTALLDEHFERTLELNPLRATFIGDYRFNDRLENPHGPEYRAASTALDEEFLRRLLKINREQLDYQEQISFDLFRLDREQALEGYQFPSHLAPINQKNSLTITFVQLGSGSGMHPFEAVDDYDDFLSRADDFAINVDQIIRNMKEGMQKGIVQPRILIEKLVPQLESQIVDDPTTSGFFTPIHEMSNEFSAEDRERLQAAFRDKISKTIIPAFERLKNFISDEYLAAARASVGLSFLPGGEDWYAYLIRLRTTTTLTADEIHQVGLDEVDRIHEQIRGAMDEVGFAGDLEDFFEFVNTDERFFFDEAEMLIQGYRDMTGPVSDLAKELFAVFPKTAFEVRRVEPFREQSAAGGSYMAGTADGARPGIFYANAYDLKARPKWAMEALFLHEAIPGHHFQVMIQRENEELPPFRRYGGYTAYSEGWGLYAESLGKELGVYQDPFQYFGSLNAELWRAIRLVVDTGIHAKGWTRRQVLDYMYANSAVAEARAVSEAERFMANPAQALAYKIGQLEIREIRDDAERRLGKRFDVKEFHTEILKDGPMPLSMLAAKLDRWVEAQL
jgi:uncharacterized protein (DUF885 family)